MKQLFVLLSFFAISFSQAQTNFLKEGPEIAIKGKYPNVNYLGLSNDQSLLYVCNSERALQPVFMAVDAGSLAQVRSKALVIDAKPYAFDTYKGNCAFYTYYANDKILVFYSVIDKSGSDADYRIYLKILDKEFNEVSQSQIGLIDNTGYQMLGSFRVVFSPDRKQFLLVSKNYCEQKKIVGRNTDVYENTELSWFSSADGKKTYSHFLPVETEDYRIKTADYQMDNAGNVVFTMTYYDIKNHDAIYAAYIGYNKAGQDKFSVSGVKLNEADSRISQGLQQLPDGDVMYLGTTGARYIVKRIAMKDGSLSLDVSTPASWPIARGLDRAIETEEGYYFVADGGYEAMFREQFNLVVIKADKQGKVSWAKTVPKMARMPRSYYWLQPEANDESYTTVYANKKLGFLFLENAKRGPAFAANGDYDGKDFPFVEERLVTNSKVMYYSLSPDGKLTHKALHENDKDGGIIPYGGNTVLSDGSVILNHCVSGKIQFVKLKAE